MKIPEATARWVRLAAAWGLVLNPGFPFPLTAEEAAVPLYSSDGYRVSEFRAPVPDTVPGGATIDTAGARDLYEGGETLFIDVLPAPERPPGLAPGALWMPLPRHNIPGSIWLPNVGYGRLSDQLEGYFKNNLQRFSGGNRNKPLVIYCLADCWMSWNAARRAAEYGYARIHWYPEGTDGWAAAGLPLERNRPLAMQSP